MNDNISNLSYKEYNIKNSKTVYNLRIEISKNNITFIVKDLNTPLDYNYKNQITLENVIKQFEISELDFSRCELFLKKFDEIFENKKFLISFSNNDIITLSIKKDNSKISNNFEISLYRQKMNNEDKFNILYNQIKIINKNNNSDNNFEIQTISEKLIKTNINMNKKEDDIKNLINEYDNIIKEIKNNIEQMIQNQKIFFEEAEKNLKKMQNEFENKIRKLFEYKNFIKKLNFKIKKDNKDNKKDSSLYFGFIPQSEVDIFISNFKKALLNNKTSGDINMGELIIKGTDSILNDGSSIELFNIDQLNYLNFIDSTEDYMKKASFVISITIHLKKEIYNFENLNIIEKFESLIQKFEISKDYEIYLRCKGNKLSLDFANFNEKNFINKLNLDLSKFHQIKGSIISEFSLNDIFVLSNEELFTKLFNLIVKLKININDIKYIINSFIEALEKVKLNDLEKQNKLQSYVLNLKFLKSFICTKMNFEFKSFDGIKAFFPYAGNRYRKDNNSFGKEIKTWLTSVIKRNLEICELFKTFKDFKFDEISINYVYPKYNNGYCLIGKFHHLSEFLNNLI